MWRFGVHSAGCKGQIYGVADFGEPLRIASKAEWAATKSQHLVDTLELPYKRTFGLPIIRVTALSPRSYKHPKGAVGIVLYR